MGSVLLKGENTLLDKLKKNPAFKEKGLKVIALFIILAVILLSLDVFTQSRDGRSQIIDEDGGTEAELCAILTDIDGVGDVDVMLQYDDEEKVSGVIVTAQGAGNPVVKNDLINAVMAVFNISPASVEVFEKESVDRYEEEDANE